MTAMTVSKWQHTNTTIFLATHFHVTIFIYTEKHTFYCRQRKYRHRDMYEGISQKVGILWEFLCKWLPRDVIHRQVLCAAVHVRNADSHPVVQD